MNPNASGRWIVAAAVLVNAVAAYLMYQGLSATPPADEPVLAPTALAVLILAVGVAVVLRPAPRTLALARGIALIASVVLAGMVLLWFLAVMFESGTANPGEELLLLLAGFGVQLALLAGARGVDDRGIVESLGSAVNGATVFFLVSVVVVGALSIVE